jgi:microsomal dipeptidase-like Zn-dependent dipeptidase
VFTGAPASAPTCSPEKNLAAELKRREYPEAAIGKILGGNLLPVLSRVLPNHLPIPDDGE